MVTSDDVLTAEEYRDQNTNMVFLVQYSPKITSETGKLGQCMGHLLI